MKLNNSTVFGNYKCRAKNEIGPGTEREIQLAQGFKPKAPEKVTLTSVTATTAVLDIVTPAVGPKVQQSTHKSGSKGGVSGVNDTLGYRVRLTNGTDYAFEQDCDPGQPLLQQKSTAHRKPKRRICWGNPTWKPRDKHIFENCFETYFIAYFVAFSFRRSF